MKTTTGLVLAAAVLAAEALIIGAFHWQREAPIAAQPATQPAADKIRALETDAFLALQALEYEEEHFDVGGAQTLAEWRMRERAARARWLAADAALKAARDRWGPMGARGFPWHGYVVGDGNHNP